MASFTIFSSKGESLPRPRFFSIPFFWGREDLRIKHSLNDLKSSLTALTKYYPAETETQPGTCVISSLPALCFLESLRSLSLSVNRISLFYSPHKLLVHCAQVWNQKPTQQLLQEETDTNWSFLTPHPSSIWQEDLLWSMSCACHLKLSQWHSQVFKMSTFPLKIPLLPSPRQPAPKPAHPTLCIPAATTGLQHHCFLPLPQGMGDKSNTSFRVQQRSWKQAVNPNPRCSSPCASVSEDLLAADQAEETGLLTLVNHMKTQSKQAWLEASVTS